MSTPSWYDVLDVEPTATTDEIRAAWRAGIAELEPGSRRFAALNQAAEVLLDPKRREAHDAELANDAVPGVVVVPGDPIEPHGVPASGSSAPPTTHETGRRVAVPSWLLIGLVVLALASAVTAGLIWRGGDDTSSEEAAREAQAAAERAIVPVLSYNYETLDADRERATAYLTGDYREDYDELFGVIADNAPSTETAVTTEVVASGIVRSGQDRVDVLLFVDRPTTNKLSATPVTYKDQVTVTMQKVGQDWLVDNLVTSPVED